MTHFCWRRGSYPSLENLCSIVVRQLVKLNYFKTPEDDLNLGRRDQKYALNGITRPSWSSEAGLCPNIITGCRGLDQTIIKKTTPRTSSWENSEW